MAKRLKDRSHWGDAALQAMRERDKTQCSRCRELEARLAKVVEAASEVAEGACSFRDDRLSYEEWQINAGSMERLRATLAAAQPKEESRG